MVDYKFDNLALSRRVVMSHSCVTLLRCVIASHCRMVVPVVVVPQLDVKTFFLKICSAAETLSVSRVVAVREAFTGRRVVACRKAKI